MKVLDYAALGMAVLASDAPAFRGSLADGPGGMLVGRGPQAWYAAINWLIRNPGLRGDLAAEARRRFLAGGTLAAQTAHRRAAWETVAQPWTKGATGMAQPASGRRAGANQPRARWRRKASVEV
jgi:glycosyltransferase involved in cell wall biosynthesis